MDNQLHGRSKNTQNKIAHSDVERANLPQSAAASDFSEISSLNQRQKLVFEHIKTKSSEIERQWKAQKHFPYFMIDGFLPTQFAEEILAEYPEPDLVGWDNTTYVHQRKKFSKTTGFSPAVADFFGLTNSPEFLALMSDLTGISGLLADPELVGGGLHQTTRDGFLDVHVDFNFHPHSKMHRRANLLVYMNQNWKKEYGGALELWDMERQIQLESILPVFNRAVMFQTNEVSYHGHPKPLKCPQNLTRKSLAVYYYTEELAGQEAAPEHNTIYRQTTGVTGYLKTVTSGVLASVERVKVGGVSSLGKRILRACHRFLTKKPPENM